MVALLKVVAPTSKKKQILLGRPVCQQAFRKLVGIGANGYARLKNAAVRGQDAPLDGRCVKKPNLCTHKISVHKRSLIVGFLDELYQTVSEPMPEANAHYAKKRKSDEVEADHGVEPGDGHMVLAKHRFRRHRGRRPNLVVRTNRGADRSQMRLLPPGSYSDYLKLLHVKHPEEKICLKLFVKVPCPGLVRMQSNKSFYSSFFLILCQFVHTFFSKALLANLFPKHIS